MTDLTIRVRYVTRPGSNVGAVVATARGRSRRATVDQSRAMDANYRDAAVILAARLGYAADRIGSAHDAATDTPGCYVFTVAGGPEPVPDIRHAVDGSLIHPWADPERRDLEATARRVFADHGHDGYWDAMTRENCGACALSGYGAHDDSGTAPYAPNHAAWARTYVQAGRLIPVEYRPAFLRELAPDNDNARYRDCLIRDVRTFGARFADGGVL